jgi:hypothetical protein
MAEEQPSKEQKIIVDEDWKSQAQAEKERLAEEVEKKAESASAAPGPADAAGEAGGRQREIPPASFAGLVNSLAAQIVFALGGMPDPRTQQRFVDLDLAKHHIDTLSVLEEKTRGNLTDDEKRLLDQVIYETRMQFVQVAQAMTEGP